VVHALCVPCSHSCEHFSDEIFVSFKLAALLRANVDPLAVPDPPSSSHKFFGDAVTLTGLSLPETNQSAPPFDRSEPISEEPSAGPAFLLSVISLPRPAEAEMSLVRSSTAYTPPPDPFDLELLLVLGVTAIALIGAARALRFRRTSVHRA
jgi:hypothetical protein